MEIRTQKELSKASKLPFCYLCGVIFDNHNKKTRDHVPPKAIFLKEDRKNSLILPTHYNCSQKESWSNEIVSQLINVLKGIVPEKKNIKMKVNIYENSENNKSVLVLEGIDLRGFISRCIKAFHACLYKEYLPQNTRNWFDTPMLHGVKNDGKVVFNTTRIQFPLFVDIIKNNRKAGKIDRIICYNNQCIYECVWEQMDDGTWACIFALNIYNWKYLGDPNHQQRRGCVGFYMPDNGLPTDATKGIYRVLEIPASNCNHLDPFDV
ncbi:MAG: hypothetical protein ABFD91_17870 [Anaerohalosphaeraceae bacterium]